MPKTKDPPRYEEAIKQTRSAQASLPEVSEGLASAACLDLNPFSDLPQWKHKFHRSLLFILNAI